MEDTRASRRYAQALYEVAKDRNLVAKVEADLSEFSTLLSTNQEFRNFYFAPNASKHEKIAVVNDILAATSSALSLELIKLMLMKGRGREVPAVSKEFVRIRQAESGIVHAQITSTIPLSETEKSALLRKLESIIGKKVEAEYNIDPLILGGVKVVYGNNSLDGSLRASLDILRQQFHHDVLKQA